MANILTESTISEEMILVGNEPGAVLVCAFGECCEGRIHCCFASEMLIWCNYAAIFNTDRERKQIV